MEDKVSVEFHCNRHTLQRQSYLEDLVGIAHGGDLVVGVGSSQFAQVANWAPADLTVHVHLLHLVLGAHEHLQTVESMRSNRKGR